MAVRIARMVLDPSIARAAPDHAVDEATRFCTGVRIDRPTTLRLVREGQKCSAKVPVWSGGMSLK